MAEDRVYSEEEIGRLLKRAAEMQGTQPRPSSYGLSLAEIKQLASESGIDPELVAAAATELKADQEALQKNFWGGPLATTLIRSIEGPISDDTWEEMLAILRREYKETGVTERRGNTRQWMTRSDDGQRAHLIATYRDGRTELELFRANPVAGVPFIIFPLVLSLASLPIILEGLSMTGLAAAVTWLTIVTAVLTISRTGVSVVSTRLHADSLKLVDELARLGRQRATNRIDDVSSAQASTASDVVRPVSTGAGPYLQVPGDEYEASAESSSRSVATGRRPRGA